MTLFLIASGVSFVHDFEPGQPAVHAVDLRLDDLVPRVDRPDSQHGIALAGMGDGNHRNTDDRSRRMRPTWCSAKFLGSFGLLVVMLLVPTLLYVVMLRIYGHPDTGPNRQRISGYPAGRSTVHLGWLILLVADRSQIVAAVASAAILVADHDYSLVRRQQGIAADVLAQRRSIRRSSGDTPISARACWILGNIVFLRADHRRLSVYHGEGS